MHRGHAVDLAGLHDRLRQAIFDASVPAAAGVASVTVDAPSLADIPGDLQGEHVHWCDPRRGVTRIGSGRAWVAAVDGEDRFDGLRQRFAGLKSDWHCVSTDAGRCGARAVLGFSFRPYRQAPAVWQGMPSALLYVPEVLIERGPDGVTLTCSATAEALADDLDACIQRWLHRVERLAVPESDAPAKVSPGGHWPGDDASEQWSHRVRRALHEIQRGGLEKVVLSRHVCLGAGEGFDRAAIMARISADPGDGIVFAMGDDQLSLMGVSPERLVSLDGGNVVSDAVAGTARYVADETMMSGALGQSKMRHEHQVVVSHIEAGLRTCCDDVRAPESPDTMRVHDLLHLWSPVRARSRPGTTLLDLAARLHPTPAVGGLPVEAACAWLDEDDAVARGWYTGALGWIAPDGDGELAVVLRCGLINGSRADLFAGAGIVAGSDPEQEWSETNWKFRTMMRAMRAR